MSIKDAFLDAEFYAAGVLWSLNETPSEYVLSAPMRDRLKRFEKRIENDVAVKRDHGVFGPVEGLGKTYAKTNIVAVPSNKNPDNTVMFATNKDVRDEIGLDRRRAAAVVDEYSKRGEHEKGFEMVKDFLAPTQSKSLRLHLLFFCFACAAYSMWKLADFRAKKDLGVPLEDEEGRTTDTLVEFGEFLESVKDYLKAAEDFLHEPG